MTIGESTQLAETTHLRKSWLIPTKDPPKFLSYLGALARYFLWWSQYRGTVSTLTTTACQDLSTTQTVWQKQLLLSAHLVEQYFLGLEHT